MKVPRFKSAPFFPMPAGRVALLFLHRFFILCLIAFPVASHAWQSDNGDGTYTNPVLNADYPDPDIIRVGGDFYMLSSTFIDSPGIRLLSSKDLVNWEIVGHAVSTIDGGDPANLVNGNRYRGGVWASSLRYRNGVFYIATQPTYANGRIYYASNPAGPWNYYQLDRNIYDPGLFFDTDGKGYIISGHGPQNVMTLNSTYSAVVAQATNLIDSGGEGSHVVKRGSYYYLFNANPSVWPFQLRCSRATNILGPWETGRVVLTATTGGHQGGLVDLNDNDQWFGFVHQDSGAIGRMTRIGPVYWQDNWPVFGTPAAPNLMGATYPKPVLGQPALQPATSDTFSSSTLGLQWQWNHNPDNAKWSLSARPGYLRLYPTQATEFWTARNTLVQKGQGPQSRGIVKLDISNLKAGDNVGFGTLGKVNGRIYVTVSATGVKTLGMEVDTRGVGAYTAASGVVFTGDTLYLRTDLDFVKNRGACSYSGDGTTWTTLGGGFALDYDINYSTFQGEKFALSCFNATPGAGYVDVDSFDFAPTADRVVAQRGRPKINAARTTLVGDNGQLLRGPYTSTEWTAATTTEQIAKAKALGFNTVHLYAESFGPDYPAAGSTAPGYALARIDYIVQSTRELGLYLVLTIGNGAYNGAFNRQFVLDFWTLYAARYKDETHVVFEVQNEPFAWGPSYDEVTLQMEADAYRLIRSAAPDSPILLFTYAVLGDGAKAVTDIKNVEAKVLSSTGVAIDWNKTAVGFHGYAGHKITASSLAKTLAAGYPCFMTEFIANDWGTDIGGQDIGMTSELERLNISWTTFLYLPPTGVSADVTVDTAFKNRIDRAGLSWVPDFGTWPVARAPYAGQPVATTTTWDSNKILTGATRLQAEDFDTGRVAYSDNDSANTLGQYRVSEPVDIETTADADGAYNVRSAAGEYIEYTLWVQQAGLYNFSLRYASAAAANVTIGFDTTSLALALPATGGAQTWTTLTRPVYLGYGRQKIRVTTMAGSPGFNWLELTPASAPAPANGTYKLVNRKSGLVITADTANNKLSQAADTSAATQQWALVHRGAGHYSFGSLAATRFWSVFYQDNNNPVDLLGSFDNGDNRRYLVRPLANGYYQIQTIGSGASVEVPSASATVAGAGIQLYAYSGAARQQWAILAATAPVSIPTGFSTAAVPATASVALAWNPVTGATGYDVKRATTSGGPYTTIASSVASAAYNDSAIVPGTPYYYVVSAWVNGVASLDSAEESGRVSPAFQERNGVLSMEAEDGLLGSQWTAGLDSVSSEGGYIQIGALYNNTATTPTSTAADSLATYKFKLSTAGNYRFWFRTSSSGGSSDSFYWRVDGGSWILENNRAGVGSWYSTDHATINALSTGSHTLDIAYRENGTRLDKFVLQLDTLAAPAATGPAESLALPPPLGFTLAALSSNRVELAWNAVTGATGYNVCRSTSAGSGYVLVGSTSASSYADTTAVNGTTYYYVVSATDAVSEGTYSAEVAAKPAAPAAQTPFQEKDGVLSIEAENGVIGSLWTVGLDTAASGGAYVEINPAYNNATGSPATTAPAGLVTYPFKISTAGNYGFWFRTSSTGVNDDSFFWRIDGGAWTLENNRAAIGAWYSTDNASVNALAAGAHTLEIAYRENGTRLDKFTIQLDTLAAPTAAGPAESLVIARPLNLAVASLAPNRVEFTWTAVAGATGYNVRRSTTSGSGYALVAAGLTAARYVDTAVSNGLTYYYTVTALNASAESLASAEITAKPVQTFAQWSATNLAGAAAATADQNADGYANLLEYYFGTSPTLPEAGTPTTADFFPDGDVAFTFRRSKNLSGVTATVQFSTDLVTWQAATATPTVMSDEGLYEILSVTLSRGSAPRFFVRLLITIP